MPSGQIKSKVKTLHILYLADEDLPKIVESDVSNIGWGGILKQTKEGEEQVILFASCTWNQAKQNYSTIEKEVKVAWNYIDKFDINLIHKRFLLGTNASTLNKVLTKDIKKHGESKFVRWQALFANFDFDVEHIKGERNCLPDLLSWEYIKKENHLMVIVTKWDPKTHKKNLEISQATPHF